MGNATFEYHKLLDHIWKYGKKKTDRTGTGTTSIFDYKIKFDMEQWFPLITTKRLHLRSIIHELLWFLKGSTNTKYLQENGVTIWDEWAKEDGSLGPVYGNGWRDFEGVDQIQDVINKLNNNPDDRGILVSAWQTHKLKDMALRPCHWAFELYTEELTLEERVDLLGDIQTNNQGYYEHSYAKLKCDEANIPKRRLSLKWHQRSVDTFLGLPFNIASYALLLHMFAQQTNMVPGTLVGDLTNVHIYDNHMEYVKKQLGRDSNKYSTPTLKLKKAKDIFSYTYEDFEIIDYETYPNWKNVPIAI